MIGDRPSMAAIDIFKGIRRAAPLVSALGAAVGFFVSWLGFDWDWNEALIIGGLIGFLALFATWGFAYLAAWRGERAVMRQEVTRIQIAMVREQLAAMTEDKDR